MTIKLAPLAPEAWDRVIAELAGRAIFLAKLLAGEMPRRHRRGLPGGRHAALPHHIARSDYQLFLPGLVEPVQAHRRGLLPARRGVRPRSLPHLHPARPAARSAARAPARGRGRDGTGNASTGELTPRTAGRPTPATFWSGAPLARRSPPAMPTPPPSPPTCSAAWATSPSGAARNRYWPP